MKSITGKSLYLIVYNLLSAAGWAVVLAHVFEALYAQRTPAQLWDNVGETLTIVQTAAAMEMLHSLLGVTRTPFMSAFLQVMSRLILVHAFTIRSVDCQSHWSLYLMITSWGLVEVPRYLFYVAAQLQPSHEIPSPLFWLRYSLFMVLYPSGITGEMFQMLIAATALGGSFAEKYTYSAHPWTTMAVFAENLTTYRWTSFLFFGYFAGGPYMIMNMVGMRKRAYRNRARAKMPISGVCWPTTGPSGERSTLKTNKAIWQAAMAPAKLDEDVRRTKSWRGAYHKWVNKSVRTACQSEKAALAQAEAGLKKSMELFQFISAPGADPISLEEAFAKAAKEPSEFETVMIDGRQRDSVDTFEVSVPYRGESGQPYYKFQDKKKRPGPPVPRIKDPKTLTGNDLKRQLHQWVQYGTIEADAANAINQCIDDPEGFVDLRNHFFVILGATSAMGPIDILLRHGATVIAVDLDRPGIWGRLLRKVRNSPGRMIFPVKGKGSAKKLKEAMPLSKAAEADWNEWIDKVAAPVSGSNLLAKAPQIGRWLTGLVEDSTISQDALLSIGNYTYLDGELHVRLSVSCNAIIAALCDAHAKAKVAFLCTPTDCHVIPKAAWNAAGENLKAAPWWQKIAATLGLGLKKNQMTPVQSGKDTLYLVDGIVPQQGPNYALAKRMQHWMAIVQRKAGHAVASNVAPSTATISVVHNVLFAWAYGGMHYFKPMEVMYPETSNALMGALLMHDISPKCTGPASPAIKLGNPMELFSRQGIHGGLWRVGYALNSTANTTVLAFLLVNYLFRVVFILGLLSGLFGWLGGASFAGNADPMIYVSNFAIQRGWF